jgi:hypothetical protein
VLSRKAVPRHRSFPLSAAPKKPNWRWGEVSASRLFCPPSSRAARPARGVSFHLCLLREPRVARVDASVRMWLLELLSLAALHPYKSHALRAWLLVFARGGSSSSRWLPRARPVLPPLGRSSLRRGLLAARWRFAPAPFRTCCRFPSSSDGPFRTRTPTPRGVGRTHERRSSRGSVLCLCARPPGPWGCVGCV